MAARKSLRRNGALRSILAATAWALFSVPGAYAQAGTSAVPARGMSASADLPTFEVASIKPNKMFQANGPLPSFEVATIKPDRSGAAAWNFRIMPTRFKAENATVEQLIRFAYNVRTDNELEKGPKWTDSERFDIDAKIADAAAEAIGKLAPPEKIAQYRLMVQSLLAERFSMRTSTRMKELPVYALVVAKNGPKLTPVEAKMQHLPWLTGGSRGELNAASVSMAFFADDWLSRQPDAGGRPVVDETGLSGSYDFTLKWTPVEMGVLSASAVSAGQGPASVAAPESSGPSLFTALQDELGLKLVPRKAPVEVLVINHVEPPSPN